MLAALAVLATGVAQAANYEFEIDGRPYALIVPPAKWYAEPLLAPVMVMKAPESYVAETCSQFVGTYEAVGCAIIVPGVSCGILINETLAQDAQDAVAHHETAHCHGWPADHPEE